MSNYSESGTFSTSGSSTSGSSGGSGARRHSIDFLFVIVLLLFLMVTSVLMILLGTGVYRRVLASMSDNYDARTCQAYVLQKVRRGQAAGQVEAGELEGVSALMGTVQRVKKGLNPALEIEGVLMTMFDGRTNLSLQVVDQVKKHYKSKVFATSVPRNVRLGEAPSHALPINRYDPRSTGAEAYRSLAREVLARNGERVK